MFLFFFYITFLFIEIFASPMCPATSIINFDKNLEMRYPFLFFDDDSEVSNLPSVNCMFGENPGRCSLSDACPLHKENIDSVLGVQNWPNNTDQLCDMIYSDNRDATNNDTINILFFGGSMTVGAGTLEECFCHHNLDESCPANHTYPKMRNIEGWDDFYCGWVGFFTRWFKQQFPSKRIVYKNYAIGGCTAALMADRIGNEISDRINFNGVHIPQHVFSSNDIVFLDHSVNDAETNIHGRAVNLRIGLEGLVRRIYHYSTSLPLVIVLEQFPHVRGSPGGKPTGTSPLDYAPVYREVAKHYGLMLWSYREMVWSDFLRTHQTKLFERLPRYGTHPPWSTQMLIADVFSNAMMTTLQQCRSGFDASGKYHRFHERMHNMPDLPHPLYNLSAMEQNMCDDQFPFLIDAHPTDAMVPANVTDYELNVNGDGWRQYVDHKGVPGWIITSTNLNMSKSILRFPIIYPKDAVTVSGEGDYMLKVIYIKSYENAGKAQVFVCGQQINFYFSEIDALWTDFKDYRFSIPQVYTQAMGNVLPFCNSLPAEERFLEIRYSFTDDNLVARRNQKLKILQVESCHSSALRRRR